VLTGPSTHSSEGGAPRNLSTQHAGLERVAYTTIRMDRGCFQMCVVHTHMEPFVPRAQGRQEFAAEAYGGIISYC